LSSPFFKQFAKKKDYLVKAVLTQVPPLDHRSHFKRNNNLRQKDEAKQEQEQQWDFENAPDVKEKDDKSKLKHITFINNTADNHNGANEKSISFGVVAGSESIIAPAPVRKSRFVVEEQTPQHPYQLSTGENNTTVSSLRSMSPYNQNYQSDNDTLHHSIFTHHSTNTSTTENSWQSSMGIGLGISSSLPEVEIKKGRFSVNQQQTATKCVDPKLELVNEASQVIKTRSLSRVSSFDNLKNNNNERKSRFEVQHVNNTPPLSSSMSSPALVSEAIPMSRHSSFKSQHQRSISRDSTKAGRFLIETNSGDDASLSSSFNNMDSIPPVPPIPASLAGSPDCRKKGRFELTGGAQPNLETKDLIETLLKQNESQKSVLCDLMNTMYYQPERRGRSLSVDSRKITDSESEQMSR
jgi:hypothetical protein